MPKQRRPGQIIAKGSGKWLVRVYLGEEAGKRKYHSETVTGTKKLAESTLASIVTSLQSGRFVVPSKLDLNAYLDRWLREAAQPKLRRATYDSYSWLLQTYVRPYLGSKELCKLRPLDIQTLINTLRDKGLSARTVRYAHSVLRTALNAACRWQLLDRNPCQSVELPRQTKKEKAVLAPEQINRFIEASQQHPRGIYLVFLLSVGCRPSEALGVQWKDIDWNTGTLVICRTLARPKGGGWCFEPCKTAGSRRQVALPASLTALLREHRTRQLESRLADGAAYENHDLVFATATGQPLSRYNLLHRELKAVLKAAELEETLTLYSLRHSFASSALNLGQNPKVVAQQLGNSPTLVLSTYAHATGSMLRQAANCIDEAFFGRPTPLG